LPVRGGSRRLKELRRRCEERLEELSLPVPFDLEAFCESVAVKRGHPILLQPVEGVGGGTMGVWIPTEPADIIVYEQQTTRLHREHIVLHELSHLICEHRPKAVDAETAGLLFPDVRWDVVKQILQRQAYSTEEELEAELLASLIRDRAGSGATYLRPPGEVDVELAKRLEAFNKGETPT
jgi:hypothetical protein